MTEEILFNRLKSWYQTDLENCIKWRKIAQEDYNFYNGHHWNDRELAILRAQRRPVISFNRIAPIIQSVLGSEINNRRQIRFIPREQGDIIPNELLTATAEWFREQSEANSEESEAFRDAIISGIGWTDTRLCFDDNPRGAPVVERLDPFKMVWDSRANRPNLKNAERLFYVDEKNIEELKILFPGNNEADLHADWALYGSENLNKDDYDNIRHQQGKAIIVECRWKVKETYYQIILLDGQTFELSEKDYLEFRKNTNQDYSKVKFRKTIIKRAFLGNKILQPIDEPLTSPANFGWSAITGFYDLTDNIYYGLTRAMKDPQRWANKFFSQVMHILNSQTKGGILAERGAFENDRQAAESLAKSDQITWMKSGSLSNSSPRIQPKPAASFPDGFFALFNESKNSIYNVTGISQEFLGTRAINQPGVLEMQRKESSLNLLAPLFDNLKKYRKNQAEIMLYLIQNYLSDGRLIRILGTEKQEYVKLTRENIANIEYDIIVDDAPTSTNEKEKTFEVIKSLLPFLRSYMSPELTLDILKYSPLPSSLIEKLKSELDKKQEVGGEDNALQPKDIEKYMMGEY
ncbi:phage portal protein [Bartonella sp. DGB1]|uniref:portal protein n=1 Tax=Bartonella sp. DGB1 TaxID=3239807 RepID=UPI00352367CE